MNRMTAVLAVWLVLAMGAVAAEVDLFEEAPWSGGVGFGFMHLEGDQLVEDSAFLSLKLNYAYSPRWSFDIDASVFPALANRTFEDGRRALDDDTWALRLGVDALLHLRNIEDLRWDPFLAAGVGLMAFGEDPSGGEVQPTLNAGGGMFYHFNDEWAVRGDLRAHTTMLNSEFQVLASVGVMWRWGARVAPAMQVAGGELDSDGEGLFDREEQEIGTDPYDPDTDKDGLTDYQEVRVYSTDPLNPDSDMDSLTDGAEVNVYTTNPLDADTDDGGVRDGHEVIEDGTDPLNPHDDLQLFTLNIEFDYDKAILKPQYHGQLDVIVKVLQRDAGATARVEGHADKRKTSQHEYNIKLSERRARAVVDYLVNVGGIDRTRLVYKGYGFTRPVAPNDTEENMQKNRRTEIYIRPSGQPPTATPNE
ncbi:MAG: OmpA family protein [Verrucomicrobia bacterium]|nr:OmpA family protein [Verrucomicrobiota bacterium]MBU1910712.1 OmpA family protein [Verrucomicrobiota bacterium]